MDYLEIFFATVAGASFLFNIYLYRQSKAKLKVSLGYGQEVNKNGCGTYLAGIVSISNIGDKPTYFSCIKAIQSDGDYYFPLCTLKGGDKIEPGQSIVGYIPVGHLVNNSIVGLIVCDGVWKEYSMPKRKVLSAINELENEKIRLESHGFDVHPTSRYKDMIK